MYVNTGLGLGYPRTNIYKEADKDGNIIPKEPISHGIIQQTILQTKIIKEYGKVMSEFNRRR